MVRALTSFTTAFPRGLEEFRQDIDSLFQQFFGARPATEIAQEFFSPRLSVAETENDFEITVDLPGINPDEIDVELKGGDLWLTGERKREEQQKGKAYHRVEQWWGRFQRVIPLPSPIDEQQIEAHYKDGVLRIMAPKAAEARAKRIAIKT